jgi:hypothetical protein
MCSIPAVGAAENSAPELHVERGTCNILFAFDVGASIDLQVAEHRITTARASHHHGQAARIHQAQAPRARLFRSCFRTPAHHNAGRIA